MKEIDKYMTPAEAALRWGENLETVKNRLKPINKNQIVIDSMIERGLIKYFIHPNGKHKSWIVSEDAMREWFGEKKI
jgi:hypothetical protein